MPSSCTFEEAQRLARELAPVLAAVPRELSRAEKTTAARKTVTAVTASDCYGSIVVHIRRYVDLPIGRRPRAHDYCIAHGISETSFASGLTKEKNLRSNPAALAERDLYEGVARALIAKHPRHTRKHRLAFAHAHGLDKRAFVNAIRRVEIIAAHEAREHAQKGRAA